MNPSHSSNKKLFLLSLFAVLGLLLVASIVTIELIFGSWFHPQLKQNRNLNLLKNYTALFDVSGLYPHTPPTIRYSRNQHGLRGTYTPEAKDTFKIITVGGSTTDCRYVDDENAWPNVLQKQLAKQRSTPIQVGNAGMDGHSTRGHLSALTYWLPHLKPNMVLFLVGINDMAKRETKDSYDNRFLGETLTVKEKLIRDIRENSVIYNLIRKIRYTLRATEVVNFQGGAAHARIDLEFFTPQELAAHILPDAINQELPELLNAYAERLNQIISETQKLGATPVLITQPTLYGPFKDTETGQDYGNLKVEYFGQFITGAEAFAILDRYNQTVLDVCKTRKIPCIDLSSRLPESRKLFYDFFHFTEEGSIKVGEIIAEELARQL